MSEAFAKKRLDSPRLSAEIILAYVLGCQRLKLYLEVDRPASADERERLRELVSRALNHEPVQYLVGEGWFFGLPFAVDRRVLVPRPATETIVEHVLQHCRAASGGKTLGENLLVADLCTGSGCIAIALLKNLPLARAAAGDLSADALDVARTNAARHAVADRLDLLQGDLFCAFDAHPVISRRHSLDYLVSNPPYIPDDEWGAVEANVKDHEPHLALRGGPDGLDLVRPIMQQGPEFLKPGGLMLVEVAASRAEDAAALAAANPLLENVRILKDFEGLNRVIVANRRA
jgi:release factor glutamine methyltransferase